MLQRDKGREGQSSVLSRHLEQNDLEQIRCDLRRVRTSVSYRRMVFLPFGEDPSVGSLSVPENAAMKPPTLTHFQVLFQPCLFVLDER